MREQDMICFLSAELLVSEQSQTSFVPKYLVFVLR